MPTFNVLTVNAHMGFDLLNRRFVLPELRDAIRSVGADLVFLQEVMGANARHARRHPNWPQGTQYQFLADEIWPHHAYGRNAVYPDGHHGNALLSTFPILRYDNRDVSIDGHEGRGLLHAVLELPDGVELHAVCVHLGLRESHRQRQLDLLARLVHDEIPAEAPLVVAGDFNDWRVRGHGQVLRCGLHEAFEQTCGSLARSFPARYPTLRLDRIYLRGLRAEHAEALCSRPWSHLSDHAPLLARVAA
ncbi:endonuclease/exonuclease/phosphatase family protein [Lysobacter korlensis]|uniref:Endonuclease/exonuclease/phosphatase family protein n=1 Tax=Lysobacter korlensis TaxID=553636 RepID=A0ABV6RQF7_9GAMM